MLRTDLRPQQRPAQITQKDWRRMAKPSKKTTRHEQILGALAADPAVRIRELALQHDVSPETIRRDLEELDAAGALLRTYGGAVRNLAPEGFFAERMERNVSARKAICAAALEAMGEVGQMFLCGGSTAVWFARALAAAQRSPLVVVTQSFAVARELSSSQMIRVQMLPGTFHADEGILSGPDTVSAVAAFHAPLCIMTASGVTEAGVSEGLEPYAHCHAAMIEASDRVLLLTESEKFGQAAFIRIATWSPKLHVISEAAPAAALAAHLGAHSVPLTIAAEGSAGG